MEALSCCLILCAVPPREASAQATRFGDTLSQAMIAKQLKQVQQAFTVQSDRGGREGPREFESLGLFVASNNREVKEAMRRSVKNRLCCAVLCCSFVFEPLLFIVLCCAVLCLWCLWSFVLLHASFVR